VVLSFSGGACLLVSFCLQQAGSLVIGRRGRGFRRSFRSLLSRCWTTCAVEESSWSSSASGFEILFRGFRGLSDPRILFWSLSFGVISCTSTPPPDKPVERVRERQC
jgi:hypothetical protein